MLWWEKVPVRVQATILLLNIVDKNAVSSIRANDKGIYMTQLVSLTRDFFLDQVISSVVGKNSMDFFSGVAADIRSKHDTAFNSII